MMTAAITISSEERPACAVTPLSWVTAISPATRGAERRQQIGADAHPAGRDAGIDRGLLVAAGREGLVAPARLGEHEGADDDDHQRDRDLVVEAEGVGLAEVEELGIVARLHRIADRLCRR